MAAVYGACYVGRVRDPDIVVIGAGPNGLSAACVLARAGMRVLVLEANPERAGGAAGSAALTLPGFVHDVGAAFFPFATASPAFNSFALEEHGVRWKHTAVDSCHPAPDGSNALLARDLELMGENFGSAADGQKWVAVCRWYAGVEDRLLKLMLPTLPPLGAALSFGLLNGLRLLNHFLRSGAGLSRHLFSSAAARRVIPGLALHTDVGPRDYFGAGIGYMLAVMATTGGFAVVEGGSQRLSDGLCSVLSSFAGVVQLGARVQRIIVDGGGARGVVLADGSEIRARLGVIANVAAPHLFLNLLEAHQLPGWTIRKMRRFVHGWGTFKMDWALQGAVPWSVAACRQSAVVHAGDSLDDLDRFTTEVRSGKLPSNPYLVVGQQSLADPTRAPAGQHTLWSYTRVPSNPDGGWPMHRQAFADRVEERIEALAPGFRQLILSRRITSPVDFEQVNANLVGGDIGGGSNAWNNQLIMRPLFPYFRYRMPVPGLYLSSSYTHPGAGVHGMCGYNAAMLALKDLG